jgi:hypothetical protein
LVLANYKEDQQRALQQREDRMRRSSADDRDKYASGLFTDEEDDDTTPQDRREDQRTWYTQRWGDLEEHISDDITREGFVASGYVVKHRPRQGARQGLPACHEQAHTEPRNACDCRKDPPPTPDVDADEVTLGTHGDKSRSRYDQGWWQRGGPLHNH